MKKIKGCLTFFDVDGLSKKTCCIDEAVMSSDGKFSGSMYDCNEPENIMKVTNGDFGDNDSCKFDFDSAGELFRVVINNSSAIINGGYAEFGLMGKYFRIGKEQEGSARVFAAFLRLD